MASTLKPLTTQLQDEIEYGENGMFRKYLVKNQKRQAMLICLQTGIEIPEHPSKHDGLITVIQGRGVFMLGGRKVILTPGVFIELPANTLHSFTVTENLVMLKVVERHKSSASVAENQPKQITCVDSLAEILKPLLEGSVVPEASVTETFARNFCQSMHED